MKKMVAFMVTVFIVCVTMEDVFLTYNCLKISKVKSMIGNTNCVKLFTYA